MYQYPNYLCHHGIKGMKWGVRRYSGGVTKNGKPVSNRKAKKAMIKASNKPGENIKSVRNKILDEYLNSNEYISVNKSLHNEGATVKQIEQALQKRDEIVNKYLEASRSAFLKDIGYDDTQAGRDFVGKLAEKYA